MTEDRRLPLISATGSCRMGREVGQKVAARLGRCLLELGGNNAIILTEDADMDMAKRAIVFGSVGTAGQRCTTTRRLLCVGKAAEKIVPGLVEAYKTVKIGNPMSSGVLMGPLINEESVLAMKKAVERAEKSGCEVLVGGQMGIRNGWTEAGHFVEPTIIRVPKGKAPAVVTEETFAPILYVQEFDSLEEAIEAQNGVDQGLSSAIFTDSVRAAERFLSPAGSDCGIAECQHRDLRSRDRRGVRRREGHRRRQGIGLGRVENLHASPDLHGELLDRTPIGARDSVRVIPTRPIIGTDCPQDGTDFCRF